MALRTSLRRWAAATAVFASIAGISFATAPAANAGMRGCNQIICITMEGSGLYTSKILASLTYNSQFYGYLRIYGGGLDRRSYTQTWRYGQGFTIYPNRNLPNGAWICVEGVSIVNGRHSVVGRPCGQIKP